MKKKEKQVLKLETQMLAIELTKIGQVSVLNHEAKVEV